MGFAVYRVLVFHNQRKRALQVFGTFKKIRKNILRKIGPEECRHNFRSENDQRSFQQGGV